MLGGIAMPLENAIATAVIIAAFTIFALALAYASRVSG
jgi:hypothetical protein